VGGLDALVTKDIFRAAFLPFGPLVDISIPFDNRTGTHRGFGFVEFEDADDAQAAVDNMHNAELYGRVLKVNLSNKGIGGNAAVWENNDEGQDDEEGKAAQGKAANADE